MLVCLNIRLTIGYQYPIAHTQVVIILMKDVDASVIFFEMNYMYNKTSNVCYESE